MFWLCGLVSEIGGIKDTCDPKLTEIGQSMMSTQHQSWIVIIIITKGIWGSNILKSKQDNDQIDIKHRNVRRAL